MNPSTAAIGQGVSVARAKGIIVLGHAKSDPWDAVADAGQIDIPGQFATFIPAQRFKLQSSAIQ